MRMDFGTLDSLTLGRMRLYLLIGALLIVVLGGLRFSDGSMLLAMARGATVADPVFANPATQYVWDSPAKVLLLQALPAKILVIAVIFGLLAILPLLGVLSADRRTLFLTGVLVLLTPAFKVSIQNMGMGDGLVMAAIGFAIMTRHLAWLGGALLLIALWHPQQSFFIGLSMLLAWYAYTEQLDRRRVAAVLAGLALGCLIFLWWKASLGFEYAGRGAYMRDRLDEFLDRSVWTVLFAFLPVLAWFGMAPRPRRGGILLAGWITLLALVAFLTTDVTRVMALISLPIVLVGADALWAERQRVPLQRLAVLALLLLLLPPFSWSGFDVLLWGDLLADACKWGLVCLGAPGS
ncbi:MAG: hypothetical protein MUE46_18520 [Xanthomonadales bacterium]|jgi:hypothetical protein|nr:hypothetical protein [Xanthomonadales bacterium]